MKAQAGCVLLLAVLVVAGCGGSPGDPVTPAPNLTGNWMIDSSVSATGALPQTLFDLTGALQSSGSQVTGIFRPAILSQGTPCLLLPVLSLKGSIDSHRDLTLTSTLPNGAIIKLSLALSVDQPYAGTVELDGGSCPIPSTAVTGMEIANTSGTFSGALTPEITGSSAASTQGNGTLVLTQSTTPDSTGRFPATGTLSYKFDSCSGSVALAGSVTGPSITLSTAGEVNQSSQTLTLSGGVDISASKIAALMVFHPIPCSTDVTTGAVYSGTLARQ